MDETQLLIRLQSALATMRKANLDLAARVLRLELAVSALDKDGTLDAILRPDKQPEQF